MRNISTLQLRNICCVLFLYLLPYVSFSQDINFEEITFIEDHFEKVKYSSIDEADVDGDGDIDIIIAGTNESNQTKTKLYINEGGGNYVPSNTYFIGVSFGSVDFEDIDKDNDQDLLITGNGYVRFYINDGNGNFSSQGSPYLTGVTYSSTDFGDIDGDGDQDLIIASYSSTKLYKNNGLGRFTEVSGLTLPDAQLGSVDFADFDSDNDLDFILTGYSGGLPNTDIYINDGSGNFIKDWSSNLPDVGASAVAVADVDGDNDKDLLITGSTGTVGISKLYLNDGSANFSPMLNTSFLGVTNSSAHMLDIDHDGDCDVILSGKYSSLIYGQTKVYLNDGLENFEELSSPVFNGIMDGDIAFCDMDGDNDTDMLLTGFCNANYYTNIYFNENSQGFLEVGFGLEAVCYSSSDFADIDGDGDKDLLICGNYSTYGSNCSTSLYKNVGNRNFVLIDESNLKDLGNAKVSFADIDGDNDQDILLMGNDENYTKYTLLYKNDGTGSFTEVEGSGLAQMRSGDAVFFDANNDGAVDLFITGYNSESQNVSILYFNDGSGNFYGASSDFISSPNPTVSCGDVDNDGDIDLFLSGSSSKSHLYLNIDGGNFVSSPYNDFPTLSYGDSEFSDIDKDGDLDLILMGQMDEENYIFKNDGAGVFEATNSILTEQLTYASIDVSDVDKDGDLDLLISGMESYNQIETKLFKNVGYGAFEEVTDIDLVSMYYGDVKFADFDGDTDEDLLIVGRNSSSIFIKIYENLSIVGIEEHTGEVMLKIYPNPLKGNARITLGKTYNDAVLHIYNIEGKLVFSNRIHQSSTICNINLPKGLYMLQLTDIKGKITKGKMIVE